MVSFVGLEEYFAEEDAAKRLAEERMDKKELLALDLAMKYGNNFLTKSGSSKGTPTGVATAALMKNYNIGKETLAPILATGDSTAASNLLNILEKQRLLFENEGLTLPDEVVSGIVESAVLSQPTASEIDFTEMEKFIGREMDSMYKDLLKSQSSGAVFFPQPAFVEKPSIEDLDKFEKRAISFNLSRAKDDVDAITIRINELESVSETTNLSQEQIAERGWLMDRKIELENATKSYENDNVMPLAGLYGTTYTKILQDAYPSFKNVPLNPALLNAAAKEITVPNRAVAESLAAAGILKAGDVVINSQTGNPIPIQ